MAPTIRGSARNAVSQSSFISASFCYWTPAASNKSLQQRSRDGTAVLSIIGQVPFGFTGVLKIDLDTGEAILEPQHSTEGNVERACAASPPEV